MAWDVVKVTWSHPERKGTIHDLWREEIVASAPTIAEARAVTADRNTPGNGHLWQIRWSNPPAEKGQPS